MNKILMGSKYFFACYSDFNSKDIDEIAVIETNEFKHKRHILGQDRCLFLLKKQASVDDYINLDIQSPLGMVVGKYLVPEFCEEIGFTIEDLPKIKSMIDKLDIKHRYEKIIYDSYIENNDFTLTDEQRDKAYQSYKQSRRM